MTSSWWTGVRTVLAFVLLWHSSPAAMDSARAQESVNFENGSAWLPAESALQLTMKTGCPSVVVVTSRSFPASLELLRSLQQASSSCLIGRFVTFTEMPQESFAKQIERMGLKTFPAILVYGREGTSLKLLGVRKGELSGPAALAWLGSLPITPRENAGSPKLDPAVAPAAYDAYPSGQGTYPSSQSLPQPPAPPKINYQVPPPQPMVSMVPYQQAQSPPIYAGPVPQPVVVATPSQPVVIQPSQPQIIVGPSQAPQITFASAPTAPTISYVQPANAPQPGNAPQQIFMANAPTAGAPQPSNAPPPGYAPMAMAPQPMAYAPMAMAPQPTANAPTGQSPILAAALLTNPRLWERLLGALGDHLAQKKNPRIQMSNSPTVAQAPVAMAPTASGYAPVAQPAMMMMPGMAPAYGPPPGYMYGYAYGPPPGYCPPGGYGPPPGYPPPNAPSPQSNGDAPPQGYAPAYQAQPAPQQQGSFLHRLLHH